MYNENTSTEVPPNKIPDISIKTHIIRYWYWFVILLFGISSLVLWNVSYNRGLELESVESKLSLQSSLDETNAKLNDVLKRENEIYPKLIETKKELTDMSKKLTKIQDNIKLTRRDTINAEVSKMDLYDLSNYLNANGYSNIVISK